MTDTGDPKPKRRLPVLQNAEPDEEKRPAAQWIAIGAGATLIAWLALAMVTSALAKRVVAGFIPADDPVAQREAILALTAGERVWLSVVYVLGPMITGGLAAMLGGLLVGRFGGEAGKNEGTLAGVAAGVVVSVVLAWGMIPSGQGAQWLMSAAIITVLVGLAGRGGAALGLRLRK